MFTLEELLRDCCPEISVLNSGADLSRTVFSADITETPDVSDYISENTLVITTGMAFQDDPERLSEFITKLNEKPVPGIAIKLERFINKIPESVIETADSLGFPILIIPKKSTLGIVSHKILSYIWNSQAKTLARAIEVNREFSKFVSRNTTVSSLISHLSKMLSRSILFLSPFLAVETSSVLDDVDEDTVDKSLTVIRSYYMESGNQNRRKLFNINRNEEKNVSATVFPVMVDRYQKYLLVVFNTTEIPFPFSELVLEQVTIPIAFVQYKYQILEQSHMLEREKFFNLVCSAQNEMETFHLMLSAYPTWYGLETTDFYQVIVSGIDNLQTYDEPQQVYGIVYRWLEREIPNAFAGAVVFALRDEGRFAIVLQQSAGSVSKKLEKLSERLGSFFPFILSFTIGSRVESLDSIWFSHLRAQEIYRKAVENREKHFVKEYFSQGMQDVVRFIPQGHAKHFAKYILKELAYPKTKLNQELRQTLTVFMDNRGDLTRTAKDAYLHRNTVRYRIQKVESILGVDLDDPEVSLNVRMALLLTKDD